MTRAAAKRAQLTRRLATSAVAKATDAFITTALASCQPREGEQSLHIIDAFLDVLEAQASNCMPDLVALLYARRDRIRRMNKL